MGKKFIEHGFNGSNGFIQINTVTKKSVTIRDSIFFYFFRAN